MEPTSPSGMRETSFLPLEEKQLGRGGATKAAAATFFRPLLIPNNLDTS